MDWQSIIVCGKKILTVGNVEYWSAFGHVYRLSIINDNITVYPVK